MISQLRRVVPSGLPKTLYLATKYRFTFDPKQVVRDQAKFELELSNNKSSQALQDKIYDLHQKLNSESPFNESEKAMMLMMSMADLSMRSGNIQQSQKIFDCLSQHLDKYSSDNNMAFYQYLAPAIVFRKALILEQLEKQENKENNQIDELLLKAANMIEDYHNHSQTLIEENVRLLAKVYDKLGGRSKKVEQLEESFNYYKKALEVGKEAFNKQSVFVVKMNCFVGDLLSRINIKKVDQDQTLSLQDKTEILQQPLLYLQEVLDNIQIRSQQDGQIFSIACNAVLKVMLSNVQVFPPAQVYSKIEEMEAIIKQQDKVGQFITPLSRSVFLTMKAENFLSLGEKEKAKQTFDDSLALSLKVFPPKHKFVQNIFKKMQQL